MYLDLTPQPRAFDFSGFIAVTKKYFNQSPDLFDFSGFIAVTKIFFAIVRLTFSLKEY
jgi:hypothetical protein